VEVTFPAVTGRNRPHRFRSSQGRCEGPRTVRRPRISRAGARPGLSDVTGATAHRADLGRVLAHWAGFAGGPAFGRCGAPGGKSPYPDLNRRWAPVAQSTINPDVTALTVLGRGIRASTPAPHGRHLGRPWMTSGHAWTRVCARDPVERKAEIIPLTGPCCRITGWAAAPKICSADAGREVAGPVAIGDPAEARRRAWTPGIRRLRHNPTDRCATSEVSVVHLPSRRAWVRESPFRVRLGPIQSKSGTAMKRHCGSHRNGRRKKLSIRRRHPGRDTSRQDSGP
jgi:hypothetical protein